MPNCQEWENDWGTPTLPEDSNSLLTPLTDEELNPGLYDRSDRDRRDRDRRDRESYRNAYRRRW